VEKIRSQVVVLRDGRLETSADDLQIGVGLRVVFDGAFGFAASVELTTDVAAELADQAVQAARVSARAVAERVELAEEPSYGEVSWTSSYELDPSQVPTADKVALLEDWSHRLLRSPGIDHVTADVLAVVEDKHYGDLAGTVTTQRRVRVQPVVEAIAVGESSGGFESMRTLAPPAGRGWEYLLGQGWDWDEELALIPGYLAGKLRAPSVRPGVCDLVVDPTNLWLTIHESVGHGTELDRAMGYEAGYAGTSFATFDKLGSLAYGSPVMNVTGDRTVDHGLATIGYDDEGVKAQKFDLIVGGVLVGYQLDRRIARQMSLGRSNGCAFADSSEQIPMQRLANVSLAPAPGQGPSTDELISAVDDGFYVVGDKSWSIDMQRHNFQFTGQRFFKIENGKLAGQVKDLAYQSRTTDFWGAMEAVGGQQTYRLGGAMNCGKGQPSQTAPVSHGCPSALFRGVSVLNARTEAGR
jgi:TldD protein